MRIKTLFFFLLILNAARVVSQSVGLDMYIQQAIETSPLLQDYQNQLQSSALDSVIINAQRKPQINAIGQLLVAPAYNGWGYDGAVTNSGNYLGVVNATQTIFAKKIYAPKYEAISIQKQSITNTSKISEHDLRKSITDQYLIAYTSLNAYTYSESTFNLLKEEEILLKNFVEKGIYKQTDYLSFEIAIQSQEIQMKQFKMQYKNDLRQLNLICGINDTAYHLIQAPTLKTKLSDSSTSPFLMQFKIDSLSIINQKNLVNANYHPRLSWFADAGFLGSNPALLYKNFGSSFGLNFSMPLYDGKQKKIQHQKLSIVESTRNNYQQFFKNQYNQHIVQINMQLIENEQLSNQIQKQLASSETLISMSKLLLNKGELSVTDFIVTIKNYIDIKNQQNQMQLAKLQLINEFNYWNW
jgi:outer membrane protein TolC